MPQNTYIQLILRFFSSMDIENLRLFLNDEYTYQDTTKEIFLNEIEVVFNAHKHFGDTELLIYKGKCAGETCENCGKKGFRFVGNKSKNFLDLIFETEGNEIKDIYSCSFFKSRVKIDDLGSKAYLYINKDDKVGFEKTPEYWSKVYAAYAAKAEIIADPPKRISFEKLTYWLAKHEVTDEFIGHFNPSLPTMRWSHFSNLYSQLLRLKKYISKNLKDIKNANQKIKPIKKEKELIEWVLDNELIFKEAPFHFRSFVEKERGDFIWQMQEPIIFEGETFTEVFNFLSVFDKKNERLLKKYTTYTMKELIDLVNNYDPADQTIDFFSLRFHMENRKALKEMGVNVPLYINKL